MSHRIRKVHKNRVIAGTTGKVDKGIMRKIDEYLLQMNVTAKNRLRIQQNIIDNRNAEITQLKTNISHLQTDNQTLSLDNISLQSVIQAKDNTIDVLKKKEAMFEESKKTLKQFQEYAVKTGLFDGQPEMKKMLEKLAQ
jgi:regulator of replication initiation timing